VLATTNCPAVTGTTASDIVNRSVSFTTSGGAEVGQEIRLVFIDATTPNPPQIGIDNISLDATVAATPEPPTIVALSPTNNATGFVPEDNLIVTFDEVVQKGTGNIVIKQAGGSIFETIAVTNANVTISGAVVTINPTAGLDPLTEYYVEIDSGAIQDKWLPPNDFAGFSGSAAWSFTTRTIPSTEYFVAPTGSDTGNTGLGWESPFLTISHALAQDDTAIVTVADGTYNITAQIVVSKAVTVRSFMDGVYGGLHNASNTVVQRSSGTTRIFSVTNPDAVLDGLTIRNGSGRGDAGWNGNGVFMTNGCTVMNCIIRDNAPADGSYLKGAGVHMAGGVLSNCVVTANASGARGGGAGIYANGGQIINCQVLNNTNNYGWFGGGGIYANNAQIINCQVVGNTSSANRNTTDPTDGGGINAQGSTLVRNCLVVGNVQSVEGSKGGLGGGVFGGRIESCTIEGNSASHATGTSGGGVYGSVVTNSIVWNNTTGSGTGTNYGGACTFGYSCSAPLPAGDGNVMSDPLFVDGAAGNYQLAKTPTKSPCIDTGIYMDWMATALDLAGNQRVHHKRPDMGAYEREYVPAGAVVVVR
jgi:hypothetical protein